MVGLGGEEQEYVEFSKSISELELWENAALRERLEVKRMMFMFEICCFVLKKNQLYYVYIN